MKEIILMITIAVLLSAVILIFTIITCTSTTTYKITDMNGTEYIVESKELIEYTCNSIEFTQQGRTIVLSSYMKTEIKK